MIEKQLEGDWWRVNEEAVDVVLLENEEELLLEEKPGALGAIYEVMELLVGAICLMLFLTAFLFRTVEVHGGSMLPTLEEKEKLIVIVNNGYWGSKFKRGDIVVVNQPNAFGESLIKRVIAKEGDVVDINFETGEVKVNGEVIEEAYIAELTYSFEGTSFPIVVPKEHVFVMGDNRNHSTDSRCPGIGTIDKRYLHRVWLRYLPLNKAGRP